MDNITFDDLINFFKNNNKLIIKSKSKLKLKLFEKNNSNNFTYFNNIFEHYVDEIEIRQYNKKQMNISLYYLLLFCLDNDFVSYEEDDKDYSINQLKKKIKTDFKTRKINKEVICNRLNSKEVEYIDMYMLSIFFNINIFLFDFELNKINCFFEENELNIYKKNIFISKRENIFRPIIYTNINDKYFKYNSSILEIILYNNQINCYSFNKNEKKFIISNDWDQLLKKYNKFNLDKIIINHKINKDDEPTKYSLNSLNSKKKNELIKLCDELKIKYNKKSKKSELSELIIKSI